MKKSYLAIIAIALCGACSKTRETPNGLKVKVLREGEGEFAVPGQFVVMTMLLKDSRDSVWRDTRREGVPMMIPVRDTSFIKDEKGVESVFRVLKKGDSVMVATTAKSIFEGQPMPPGVKPEDEFTILLCVKEVADREGINRLQEKVQAEAYRKNRMQQEGQLTLDTVAIDVYLAEKKINAVKDKSGLRYVITQQGTGAKPVPSSTVTVNYKGSLLEDGRVFDQSQNPVEFPLGNMIQGWQIGFQLLPKGTKATLYIPSSLGYGPNGYQPDIPPNAILVFDVELIDFK